MIYKAVESDVANISTLWVKMVKELNPEYKPKVDWWQEQIQFLLRTNTEYNLFFATNGEGVIGFIDFVFLLEPARGEKCAFVQHFYVEPEYRNKSIASRLYKKGIAVGRENNAIFSIHLCGEKEKEMWLKHGYVPVEALMVKSL